MIDKRLTILLFIALIAFPFISTSQGEQDSLRQVLSLTDEGDYEALINLNNALAWAYRDTRPDSALYHANKALRLSRQHDFKDLEIQSINYVGVAYRNLSNFSKAFEKYLEALKLSEERKNQEQRGYSLINLGNLYLYQTNFQGAIKYFIQGLDQAQALADKRMVGYCFLNLGRSYKGIAEYGQAELYYKQAIEIRGELGDTYGMMAAEIDLAETYMGQGNLKQAERYHLSLIERLEDNNPRMLAVVYNNISKLYLIKNELLKAREYANLAIEITQSVNSRYEEKNVLETLSRINAQGGNFEDAFENHVRYAELNQQLFSEENIRRIEQMKGQYQMEQQEVENEFLRKQSELSAEIISRQRIIITLTVLGITLLLLIAILSVRGYMIKRRLSNEISEQKDKIEADKEVIEKQSNKLKELDEAKSRFFANVSHDLRSPLSLIIGNLEMLREDKDVVLSASAIKNLDTGYKNCKRLLYLTDEINDLTKLEEGKVNLKKEVVKLSSYIGMLTEMFVGTAEYKGVKLVNKNYIDKDETIFIDPRQFEKIFYNLVSNAIRHTSKGDQIVIETHDNNDSILLNVIDTGEGISQESLDYVFDRFYQSKNNVYRTKEGLGIGLALVKELVELHDATITVESTLGLGTSFKMTFPKASTLHDEAVVAPSFTYVSERKHLYDEIDREERAGVNLPKQEKEQSTIMIVDDHPEIRYHIRQILEDDYHVIEAAHGIEALELLKHNEVSLIVSDLMMPWMDGFELIESIKANDDFNKIPILVVSARISEKDQEKVLYQGINDYLQKPFQKKELILRITNLLETRKNYEGTETDMFSKLFDKSSLDAVEKDILSRLDQIVMEKIDDENLSVYDLAYAMAASERQVYRLVKKITGLTPFEYVSEIRMKYVDYLIRKNKVRNASEAARSIGLKNVTAFSKQYEKKFGVKPSDVLKADA
ncbi:MAG: response regulator [Marinoscillum sp.]